MILLETHAHTMPASGCGHIPPPGVIRLVKEYGYDAVVITNHFVFGGDYDDNLMLTIADYNSSVRSGKRYGIKVFFGLELRFSPSPNDYLAYGFTPDTFIAMGRNFASVEEFYGAKPAGTLLYQAHPFRRHMTRASADCLDGVEVFNGNPRHDSQNRLALDMARQNGLLMLAGSDLHQPQDAGRGGVRLSHMPADEFELAGQLRHVAQGDLLTPGDCW